MTFQYYNSFFVFKRFYYKSIIILFKPDFLHATHWATFPDAESCIPDNDVSASHTGDVEVISQPSANPDIRPHTLHPPVERHLYDL